METPREPRWLDAEEAQAWRALARTLIRLPAALDAQLRRDAGITHFEYQVLALLSEAPGRTLRMSELATQAEGSLPRLSQVIARLERRGWARHTPDPAAVRTPALIICSAAYGLALAWAGVQIAARQAQERLPELCQIAVHSTI